jgi:YidC/Oxa1 family membrane protein insertase
MQQLGRPSQQARAGLGSLAGSGTPLPRLTSMARSPFQVGVAAGASRSLSFWSIGSKKQPAEDKISESESASSAAEPSSTTPAALESNVQTAEASAAVPEIPGASAPGADPLSISSTFSPETLSDLEAAHSILDIPEQIGYLKYLGLDFGWGPTACCEWLLEHVYIYSGLPWWGAIAAMAFGIRAVLFWPSIVGYKHSSRMALLQKDPEFIKANNEFKQLAYNPEAETMDKLKARAKVVTITKAHNISMMKTIVGPLALVPASIGMFRLLRSMATLPVPSLENGGFGWITDLTVADPYYFLPLAAAAMSAVTMKQHQKANLNPSPQAAAMNKFMLYGMTPLMFFFTMSFPAAVQWFFFCFAVASVSQTSVVLNPTIRRWLDMPPLPSAAASPSSINTLYQAPSKSVRGFLEGANESVADLKKGVEDYTGGSAKAQALKASEYEKKRAQEEKEKRTNRLLEHQRKKLRK